MNVIESIKNIKERIPDNHTTGQIAQVLDTLIYRGVDLLAKRTDVVHHVLATLVPKYESSSKRKITALEKKKFIDNALLFFLRGGSVKRLKLDRNYLFFIMDYFLEQTKDYPKYCIASAKKGIYQKELYFIENQVNGRDLWSVIKQVNEWNTLAKDFRNSIIEKYMRHALNHMVSYYYSYEDWDDIIHSYILNISKSIDKLNASKGTLTSYINRWFRLHLKKPKEESMDMETVKYIETNERGFNEEVHRIRKLAKYADPVGLGRLELGIEEVLSHDEKDAQKNRKQQWCGYNAPV